MNGLYDRAAPGPRLWWPILRRLKGWLASDSPGGSGWDTATLPPDEEAGGRPPCVLVVDDDPLNRLLASEMLSLLGAKPLLAADGAEAVALACELRLDLILMDLQMPVLGGLAATRQIRRDERVLGRPRAPVLAYTSTPPHDASLGVLGIDGVLAKPCDMASLQDCLSRWCPQGKRTGAPGHRGPGDRVRWRTDESPRAP